MRKLLVLLLLPLMLEAQEATVEAEQSQPEPETELEEPAPEQLRNRELGDAFRNFRPSEEITADNAVGFPVDI